MAMFVYLDESGDTGFKFRKGSSRYFVVTLLLVDDPVSVHSAIDDLRRNLGLDDRAEFRFVHTAHDHRRLFLETLCRQQIGLRALVVDKELVSRPEMHKRESFYNSLVSLVLQHDSGTITDATIVLDESTQSKRSQRELGAYLRKQLNADPAAPKVRKVLHHTSHTDNLIQAADMVSGAIYRSYERGDDRYLSLIRRRVQDIREVEPSLLRG